MSNDAHIVALAGRRIDAPDAHNKHFPLSAVPSVRELIEAKFDELKAELLVSSAACGADLIALDVADTRGMPFYIILPFDRAKFRKTSVMDRPGQWGELYDRVVKMAAERGQLNELVAAGDGDQAYSHATRAIVQTAHDIASGGAVTAIAVTDNGPRTSHDATAEFLSLATSYGFEPQTIQIPAGK